MISMLFCACATEQPVNSEKPASSKNETVAETREEPQTQPSVAEGPALQFDGDDYVVKRYDLNKDGNPDIIDVFKKIPNEKTGETTLRMYVKMMDLNRDSRMDLWRFFDVESGAVAKEELDLDFDGKIDRMDYFSEGVVRRSEFDFQFDENPDIVKSFDEKGDLVKIESDQNADGKIDYWEFYKNGALERIEKDNDNDGKSDVFKRPGDEDFIGIVDVDARFEMPEETSEPEKPAEEAPVAEEAKPEAPKEAAEAEKPAEAAPVADAAKPETAEKTPEPQKKEAEPNPEQTSEKETK